MPKPKPSLLILVLAILCTQLSAARPQPEGFAWMGDLQEDSRTLRVSLYCPKCLDLLNVLYTSPPANGTPPEILLQSYGEEDKLSPLFVSAILHAKGNTPQERFLLPFSLLMQGYKSGSTFAEAMERIQQFIPSASAEDPKALATLAKHSQRLAPMENRGTPALYLPNSLIPRQAYPAAIWGIQEKLPAPLRDPYKP